jgi:hypothetical protein
MCGPLTRAIIVRTRLSEKKLFDPPMTAKSTYLFSAFFDGEKIVDVINTDKKTSTKNFLTLP